MLVVCCLFRAVVTHCCITRLDVGIFWTFHVVHAVEYTSSDPTTFPFFHTYISFQVTTLITITCQVPTPLGTPLPIRASARSPYHSSLSHNKSEPGSQRR